MNNRRKAMRRLIKLLILVGIFGLIINVVWNRIIKPKEFISPLSSNASSSKFSEKTNSTDLKRAVDGSMSGVQGTYGIAIKNLKTGETYSLNDHKTFEAGSLYKLWIMAETYSQLQNGELKEEEILQGNVKDLNREFGIDPQSAEITRGTVTLSIKDALNQMITISHNYAAFLLAKKIDLTNAQKFLQNHNLNESILANPPKTTASDVALFLEKLYNGELADAENTQKMLELLKKQTLNDKLPKYLPANVSIAHKTGEIDYLSHDAGIVFLNKGDYIIVVLSESDSPAGAEDRIAQVSQAVYKYFTNK